MLNCRFVVDVGSDFDSLNFAPFRLPWGRGGLIEDLRFMFFFFNVIVAFIVNNTILFNSETRAK